MKKATAVNGQITDSVTQSNIMVLASAVPTALGSLYQVFASSLGLALQNAVANQQSMNAINNAITTKGVNLLLNSNQVQP